MSDVSLSGFCRKWSALRYLDVIYITDAPWSDVTIKPLTEFSRCLVLNIDTDNDMVSLWNETHKYSLTFKYDYTALKYFLLDDFIDGFLPLSVFTPV